MQVQRLDDQLKQKDLAEIFAGIGLTGNLNKPQHRTLRDPSSQGARSVKKANDDLEFILAKNLTEMKPRVIEKISAKIWSDWNQLRGAIKKIIQDIKIFNEGNRNVQNLPDEFIQRFLAEFNKEMERQNKEIKRQKNVHKEKHLHSFIQYDQ